MNSRICIGIGLLFSMLFVAGCSRESSVPGKWSRENDTVVIELLKDKTGEITADNVKIYQKMNKPFPMEIQLVQKIKCVWSLDKDNMLKIEESGTGKSTLLLKLEGKTLTMNGKVVYIKK
ncbi:MAG: hypothetical protein HXX17_04595 [Geobacteraceae bacterium]|nr:hypothetical protein [Geobacteraceae bacterium]